MDSHSADSQPAPSPDGGVPPVAVPEYAPPPKPPWYNWRRWGWNFLTVSILAHVGFGVIAAYFIVANIQGKPKQNFQAPGPKGPNAPTRAMEHRVQMAKKQQTMSAPMTAKRVTTTGLSRVALPSMPAMPNMDAAVAPASMTGMGGGGMSLGGFGGSGGGSGGGGGGGLSLFGMRSGGGGGLKGTFYDLKQTRNKTPSAIQELGPFVHLLDQFLQGGWNEGSLSQYYKAPTALYTTQIFVPRIDSAEAPKAFGVGKRGEAILLDGFVQGSGFPAGKWHLLLRGRGRQHPDRPSERQDRARPILDLPRSLRNRQGLATHGAVRLQVFGSPGGFAKGLPVELKAGEFYDMEILLGDDGGKAFFSLLVERQGVEYMKKNGLPILPVFRTSNSPPPQGDQPPFQPGGPIWTARSLLLPPT